MRIGADVAEDGEHFRGELLAVRCGIEAQQALVEGEHGLCLLAGGTQAGYAG